jgi:hypothetical protein
MISDLVLKTGALPEATAATEEDNHGITDFGSPWDST